MLYLEWPRPTSAEKSQDSEQDNRANQRRNKRAGYAAPQVQTQRPAKPTSYEGSDNSHDDVDHNAEAAAVDNTTRQGASDASDNQPENNSMRDRVHVLSPIELNPR
jgi:hypothetical protein